MKELSRLPIEIERKFIIKMPCDELLADTECHTSSELLQIYLESESHITHRIRKRVYRDRIEYTETSKLRLDKMSAYEDERAISESDFEALRKHRKSGTRELSKLRHTFKHADFIFEIDIYPEWKHTAIMEVELKDKAVKLVFPDFIEIVEEVTGNRAYSNASMSKEFPKEHTV